MAHGVDHHGRPLPATTRRGDLDEVAQPDAQALRIVSMDLDIGVWRALIQDRGAARLGSGVKMLHDAPGHEQEWIILSDRVGLLPPVLWTEESLSFGVDALVVGAGILVSGQEVDPVAFARVDVRPESQIFVEPRGATPMFFVSPSISRFMSILGSMMRSRQLTNQEENIGQYRLFRVFVLQGDRYEVLHDLRLQQAGAL